MSGRVSSFSRGIVSVVSGEGGTQSNEFEAAIKSVTSSTDVKAVFLYDTKNTDSDGGAWRKKTSHTSWAREASSATRSARKDFPAMSLIVADTSTIKVYDLDDPAMPEWLVVNEGGLNLFWNSAVPSAITALNGRIYVATDATTGLLTFDFASDLCYGMRASTTGYAVGNISERNAGNASRAGYFSAGLVNAAVNDVAATWLEGGELDSMGLVRPVVACATDGGVSVIHPNGDVYDLSNADSYNDHKICFFTEDGKVGTNYEASNSYDNSNAFTGLANIPFSDDTTASVNTVGSPWVEEYNDNREYGLAITTQAYSHASAALNAITPTSKFGLAFGFPDRLSIVKRNPGNDDEGAVAYITSSYNTGYMVGDIRLAVAFSYYSGGSYTEANAASISDRSVKSNALTVTASTPLTAAPVATGAETFAISGFSASDYLSRAYDADFDFGTGDFSVMFWSKWTATDPAASQIFVDRGSPARILIYDPSSNGKPQLYVTDGSSASNITTTNDYDDGNWHQIVALRRSSKLYIYVDGVDAQTTTTASTQDLDDSSGALRVGVSLSASDPLNGSLSLLRISATAPTPQQIKEIYEAEKPLFQANAKCLLQSDNAGSPNVVRDLAFDKSTGVLSVSQYGSTEQGVSKFRGLEAVDTFNGKTHGWATASSHLASTAGGASVFSSDKSTGGGVLVDLPALDVRAELNEGEDKTPSDGKLHFEGVTTSATPTAIGHIPIADNENVVIRAKVRGQRYNDPTSSWWLIGEVTQRYYRDFGANVVEPSETPALSLIDEGQSSLYFTLEENTGSNTVQLKVTGSASSTPMQWTASVEVQRISEKRYER